jgi:predicted HicB family RNase H-like nuclease
MKETRKNKSSTRMIHVRISEDLHKRLRISAAESDVTMQNWVATAIQNELNRQAKNGHKRN